MIAAQPGDRLPERRHRVDQDLVSRYARVSGDHNPLHTDPDFAATTHFGRTIAHGMMTLAFVSAAMESWAGPAWAAGGALDVTFLAPVFPGDEVVVSGEIAEVGQEQIGVTLSCTSGDRLVLTGIARVPRRTFHDPA